jgi:peptidoglycan/LPS O-acetylase OafA/YrhL
VNNLLEFMGSGVTMFLIIAAFFAWKSLEKAKLISAGERILWTRKHVVRLIPLYYLGLMVSVLLGERDLLDILCHLMMIHGFIPKYINSINISWFVGTLVIFYFMAPWLHSRINSLKKALLLLGISLPVCEIISSAFFVIHMDDYDWRTFWSSFGIVANFPVLLIGIVLYFMVNTDGFKQLQGEVYVSRILLWVCFYLIVVAIIIRHNILAITSYKYIAGILFAGIIFSQHIAESRLIVNKPVSIMGKYTYGMYLSHMFVFRGLQKIGMQSDDMESLACVMVMTVLLSFGISVISTKCIEKPILSVLGRRQHAL